MSTYSIIIPHHGKQELLDRCLASIPKRDDVQVIVVIDKECRGAGWARNQGLKQAKGDYVIFSDSDDYFLPDFSTFLDDYKEETSDMVFFNATSIDNVTHSPSWRSNHLNNIIVSTDRAWQERHLRYHFTEPWCRLIKTELIREHNIRFGESKIVNDIYFTTQLGLLAKTIKVDTRKLYCICNRAGSTAKRKSDALLLDMTEQVARSNILLRNNGIKHYHSRMLRPLVTALLHGKFTLLRLCWQIMRNEGYSKSELLRYLVHYPIDVMTLLRHKITHGEISRR